MIDNKPEVLARVIRLATLAQELAVELTDTRQTFLVTLQHVQAHSLLIAELLQSGRTSEALDVVKHVAAVTHETDVLVRDHIEEFTMRHVEAKGHG